MYEFDARAMWGWFQGFPQSRRLGCFSNLVHSQCKIGVVHMHISTSTKVKQFSRPFKVSLNTEYSRASDTRKVNDANITAPMKMSVPEFAWVEPHDMCIGGVIEGEGRRPVEARKAF